MKTDALNLFKMHSGDLSLQLSEQISWEAFPVYVAEVLKQIGGKVINKNDGIDMRIWNIEFEAWRLQIVYEDYPQMISIESAEPNDQVANEFLKRLFKQLES